MEEDSRGEVKKFPQDQAGSLGTVANENSQLRWGSMTRFLAVK